MAHLTREELEAELKRGGSVLIGRRIISRLENLPSQEEIDEAHAAQRAYVTGQTAEEADAAYRVPSATALPESTPPRTDEAPVPSAGPAPDGAAGASPEEKPKR